MFHIQNVANLFHFRESFVAVIIQKFYLHVKCDNTGIKHLSDAAKNLLCGRKAGQPQAKDGQTFAVQKASLGSELYLQWVKHLHICRTVGLLQHLQCAKQIMKGSKMAFGPSMKEDWLTCSFQNIGVIDFFFTQLLEAWMCSKPYVRICTFFGQN